MWINKKMGVVQRKAVAHMERTMRDHLFCKSKVKKQRHMSACRYFMLRLTVSMLHVEKIPTFICLLFSIYHRAMTSFDQSDNAAVSDGFICFAHFSLLSVSRF